VDRNPTENDEVKRVLGAPPQWRQSHEHGPRDEDDTTIGLAENDGSDILSFNIQGGDGNDEIFGGSNGDTIKGAHPAGLADETGPRRHNDA
jgi:hypothetical protein